MTDSEEISELKAKLDALEQQNEALKSSHSNELSKKRRGRSFLSAVLIISSIVLAPLATVGTWTRTMLVDTDRFVETFAPLADDPAVQAFVAEQAMNAIEENINIDGIVSDVFSGFEQLPLGEKASSVLPLLEAPAADGIRSMINSGVVKIVSSEAFSNVWETTLRETHSRTIALIQGNSNGAVDLKDDGAITLNLKTLIAEVKTMLVDSGLGIAAQIPEINKTIVLFQSDSLLLIRTLYQLATTFSFWLPWVALAFLIVGVFLANNRPRALMAASVSLAVVFFLMSSGISVGSHLFAFQVSPSIMSATAAYAIYNQLTMLMASTLVALTVLSIIVAIASWLVSSSRAAHGVRAFTQSAFGVVRDSAEKHGITTGKFGAVINQFRSVLNIATLLVAVFVLFLSRPITLSAIFLTLIVVLMILIVIELVRRPESVQTTVATSDE